MLSLFAMLVVSQGVPVPLMVKRRVDDYVLVERRVIAEQPSRPPIAGGVVAGVTIPAALRACYVQPDAGWGCVDSTGTPAGTVTNHGGAIDQTFAQGVNAVSNCVDATCPTLTDATILALSGTGTYTVAFGGSSTSAGTDSSVSNFLNAYDGTHNWSILTIGGANLRCTDGTGSTVAIANSPAGSNLIGNFVGFCSRTGTVINARIQGVDGTATGANGGPVAPSGTDIYFWRGGNGLPNRNSGGEMMWVYFYSTELTQAQKIAIEKSHWGATQVTSGAASSIGNVPSTPLGKDNTPDSGRVDVFLVGSYITDPLTGVQSSEPFKNYFAADPLAAATWVDVGTPTVTSNASAGPFFAWKNTNECDLIVDDDGAAFEGKRSLSVAASTDGGFTASGNGWVNCAAFLKQGTSGTTRDHARIRINTDGTFDAGTGTCDVTGLDGTTRRLPLDDGCAAYVTGAKTVTCDVLVGATAAETGGITVCQAQVTQSLYPEPPTIDGTSKGTTWVEIDGGSIPFGSNKGKVEVVFQTVYSTSAQAPNYTAHAAATYVIDAYSTTATHDLLLDISVMATPDGGTQGAPSIQALMYGPSETYENRFDFQPVNFDARTFYVWSYEWRPDTGTLPDGGIGVGCRGTTKIDLCPDPTIAGGCHATTVIARNSPPLFSNPASSFGQNTGNLGTCPTATDLIAIGTRNAGSSPSYVKVREISIYR